jgi:hypothetical protein
MEEFSMARQSKREYLRSIYKRYREGRRTEKTAMLGRVLQGLRLQPQVRHWAFEPSFIQGRGSQTGHRALG